MFNDEVTEEEAIFNNQLNEIDDDDETETKEKETDFAAVNEVKKIQPKKSFQVFLILKCWMMKY
jgi:hypothetical protein